MSATKSDLLQGTLDLLILKVVAMGPIHGYAISKRIQQITQDTLRIQQGSLYPALHKLEKRQWLQAAWREAESGREAKFYSLTTAGRKQLGIEMSDWERLSEAIWLVMKTDQP
jgi:PadR family transcriptional regulator, regulatory protein PadR